MGASSRNDSVLSGGQARGLATIRENAARCSRAALPQLRARVSALGYTELDLAGAQTPRWLPRRPESCNPCHYILF